MWVKTIYGGIVNLDDANDIQVSRTVIKQGDSEELSYRIVAMSDVTSGLWEIGEFENKKEADVELELLMHRLNLEKTSKQVVVTSLPYLSLGYPFNPWDPIVKCRQSTGTDYKR